MNELNELPDNPLGKETKPDFSYLPDKRPEIADVYDQSSRVKPDKAAQVLNIASKLKREVLDVNANLDEATLEASTPSEESFKRMETEHPKTYKFLVDPQNMAISHDDIESVKKVEETVNNMSFFRGVLYNPTQSGLNAMNASIARLPALGYAIGSVPQNLLLYALGKQQTPIPKFLLDNPATQFFDEQTKAYSSPDTERDAFNAIANGDIKNGSRAILAQVIQNAPNQMITIAAYMSGFGAAGLGLMGGTQGAAALKESTKAGVSPLGASLDAVTQAGAEVVGESFGTFGVLRHWQGKIATIYGKATAKKVMKELGKDLAYTFGVEFNEEFWTQGMQDWSGRASGADKTPFNIGEEFASMMNAGLIGGFSGLLMSAPSSLARGKKTGTSDKSPNPYSEIGKALMGTKIAERSAEKLGEMTASIVGGTEMQDVHINAKALDTYFQENNISPDVQAEKLGIVDKMTEARQTGGFVQLPLADWVKFSKEFENETGLKIYDTMKDDAKFNYEERTKNETKVLEEKVVGELKAADEKLQGELKKDVTMRDDYKFIFDDMRKELTTLYDRPELKHLQKTVKYQAETFRRMVTTMASAQGRNIRDMYSEMKPQMGFANSINGVSNNVVTAKQTEILKALNPERTKLNALLGNPNVSEALRQTVKMGLNDGITDQELQDKVQRLIDTGVAEIDNQMYQSKSKFGEDKLYKSVEKLFGFTDDISRAVFLLPDGRLVKDVPKGKLPKVNRGDYSIPKDIRTLPHEEIARVILKDMGVKYNSEEDVSALDYILGEGVIRIGRGYVNLEMKPSNNQMDVIYKMIRDGGIEIDVSNQTEVYDNKDDVAGVDKIINALLGEDYYQSNVKRVSDDNLFKAAKKEMGVRDDISQAAFLLPNGTLVGQKGIHAELTNPMYKKLGISKSYSSDLNDFVARGAIRLDTGYSMINIANVPTEAQWSVLQSALLNGKFGDGMMVEFMGKDGKVENSKTETFTKDQLGEMEEWVNKSGNEQTLRQDKVRVNIDSIGKTAKKLFGTTKDFMNAAFIWDDGTLIKAKASSETTGRISHSEMANDMYNESDARSGIESSALDDLLGRGIIRIDCRYGAMQLSRVPSEPQWQQIYAMMKALRMDLTVEVNTPEMDWGEQFPKTDTIGVEEYITKVLGYSQGENEPQGVVTFKNDKALIKLFKAADASTFLHEASHIWLKSMHKFSISGSGSRAYKSDWQTIAKWLNVKDGQKTLTTAQQEQFARGFERHLIDGKEPPTGLRSAFSAFKKWLTKIYKDRMDLLGDPVPEEIGRVMGRMLSSEDTIYSVENEMGYGNPADLAKLPEKARKGIVKAEGLAHEQAVETLMSRQMEELTRERVSFVNKERIKITDEVTVQIKREPLYKTISAVEAEIGGDISEINHKFQTKGLTYPEVLAIEGIALENGFSSIDEFFLRAVNSPSRSEATAITIEDKMKEYDGMLVNGTIKDKALEIVHNEQRAEMMALEHIIFQRLINAKSEIDFTQAIKDSVTAVRFEAQQMKAQAIAMLEGKPFKEASAWRPYITAERNAAIEVSGALQKKDYKAASDAKRRQLLNHSLATAAFHIKEEADKAEVWLMKQGSRTEKLPKSGKLAITADINEIINHLLSRYGFAGALVTEVAPRSLNKYVEEAKSNGEDIVVADWIVNNDVTSVDLLSIEHLRDLIDAIKSLRRVGQRANTLSTGENINELVSSIVSDIKKNLKSNPEVYDPVAGNRAWEYTQGYLNSHKNLSYIMRALDGYTGGRIVKKIMGILRDARANDNKMIEKTYKSIEKIWDKHYPPKGIVPYVRWQSRNELSSSRIYFTGDTVLSSIFSQGVTKETLIMLALNQGTELNRQRVLESYAVQIADVDGKKKWAYRISQEQVDSMLSNLEKNDWGFVQDILNLTNSFWGDISKLQRERTGIEPQRQEALKIQTKFGEVNGGYFHLEYDPRWSAPTAQYSEADGLKGLIEGSHIIPSTRRGHTKSRMEHVWGRPLKLQFGTIDRHLSQVIHDLNFSESIRDVDRIFMHPEMAQAIRDTLGDGTYKQIRPILAYVGFENRPKSSAIEVGAGWIRSRSSAFYLMYRITSVLSQLAGIGPAMHSVGPINYVASATDMAAHWSQYKFVLDNSQIMKERLGNRDREVRDAMESFRNKGKLDGVTKYGFYLQGYLDIFVAMPQWMTAYNKELMRQADNNEKTNVKDAIRIADDLVQSTQGSGDPIDLSALQRGSELQKLLTMFYTPFAPVANKQMELWAKLKQNGISDVPELLSYLTFWVILPAVGASFIAGRAPSSDDDEDKWLKWAIAETMQELFGGWIGVRDMASAVFSATGSDYKPTATISTINKVLKLGNKTYTALLEGDSDKISQVAGSSLFEALTLALHLPGRQMQVTLGHIANVISGDEEFDIGRLVYPKKD